MKDYKTIVEKEENELKEKTGIETNFSEEKVQDYMEQVIQEIFKRNQQLKIEFYKKINFNIILYFNSFQIVRFQF